MVRRLGYALNTLGVERRAEADRINAEISLSAVATVLERVVVTAAPVDSGGGAGSGTGRTLTLERLNRLPLDDGGDLTAIAALTPRVVSTAATAAAFSVAGQRPTQNHITLDGLTFAAGAMPRDAVRSTRVVTSTYDVAKGQFSGGEVASSTRSGTNAFQSSPPLRWAARRAADRSGAERRLLARVLAQPSERQRWRLARERSTVRLRRGDD